MKWEEIILTVSRSFRLSRFLLMLVFIGYCELLSAQGSSPPSLVNSRALSTNANAEHAHKHSADVAVSSAMDHRHLSQGAPETQPMDHSKMNHGSVDHSKMDHSKMNHSAMQHQTMSDQHAGHSINHAIQTELRNPNAFSGQDNGHSSLMDTHRSADQENFGSVIMDRLESVINNGDASLTYDWQAWYGNSSDRALIRAEGDINSGSFENARSELLWAHALTPYWDSQVGLRYDSGKGTDRAWLAFGVQGLAPYWVYTEATFYVNEQGRTSFRLELEYDLLITQRLILQPRTELNFYSESDASRGIASGLADSELGVRLRYEFLREFAPYVGVDWEYRATQAVTQPALLKPNSVSDIRFVAGVHFWF